MTVFAAVISNDASTGARSNAESPGASATRSLSGSIVSSSRRPSIRVPSAVGELFRGDREGGRVRCQPVGAGEQLAGAGGSPSDFRGTDLGLDVADGQLDGRTDRVGETGDEAAFGNVADDAGAPLRLHLHDLRARELEVALDAAGRSLTLPTFERAGQPGLAVVEREGYLVVPEASQQRAEGLIDRVPAPAGLPRGPQGRRLVDVDLEHRRIGDDLDVADRRTQRFGLEPRGERGDLGVGVGLVLAGEIDARDVDAGHDVAGEDDSLQDRDEQEHDGQTAERERAELQRTPPGGRAGAKHGGMRRNGPHRAEGYRRVPPVPDVGAGDFAG